MTIKTRPLVSLKEAQNKKRYVFGLFICFFSIFSFSVSNVFGQQPFSYTQYMNHLTPINTAAALQDMDGSLNLLAHKQWIGINGAPATFFIDGCLPIKSINGSAGIIAENDKFGPESLTQFNTFYAQSVKLSESQTIGLSLNFGLKSYVANYTNLNPNDIGLGPNINETKPNLGFSLLYFSKSLFLGISIPQLTIRNIGQASIKDNNLFRNNYFFTGGLNLKLANGIMFKPSTLVSYTRGIPMVTDFSGMFLFGDALGAGVNYRTNNESAIIITTDFSLFQVGYSYQFGLLSESLGRFTTPTQELVLSFRLGKKKFDIEKIKKVF